MIEMGYSELKNQESVFLDVNCIRMLMYLAKYNPGKQFEEIRTKLKMPAEEMEKSINKLITAQMLVVESGTFTLRDSTLIALDNFIQLAKN